MDFELDENPSWRKSTKFFENIEWKFLLDSKQQNGQLYLCNLNVRTTVAVMCMVTQNEAFTVNKTDNRWHSGKTFLLSEIT